MNRDEAVALGFALCMFLLIVLTMAVTESCMSTPDRCIRQGWVWRSEPGSLYEGIGSCTPPSEVDP